MYESARRNRTLASLVNFLNRFNSEERSKVHEEEILWFLLEFILWCGFFWCWQCFPIGYLWRKVCAKLLWLLNCLWRELMFLHSTSEAASCELPLLDALQVGTCFPFLMATTHRAVLIQSIKGVFYQNNSWKSGLVGCMRCKSSLDTPQRRISWHWVVGDRVLGLLWEMSSPHSALSKLPAASEFFGNAALLHFMLD